MQVKTYELAMTDYPALKRHNSPWKKKKVVRKWREMLAVFVVLILIGVIVGGLLGTSKLSKAEASEWDGEQSVAIAINSTPGAVVVYSKSPPKIGVFTAENDLYFATGDASRPFSAVDGIFELPGERASGVLTNLTGVSVSKFVYFKTRPDFSGDGVYDLFVDFASMKSPLLILLSRTDLLASTNMTRVQLLTLWWRVKGISVKQVQVKSLGGFADEVIGPSGMRFKSIDRESVWREMLNYFDSGGAKKGDVEIVNDSGATGAGNLASSIVSAYGFSVTGISTSDSIGDSCRLSVFGKTPNVLRLAKSLGCDIVLRQDSPKSEKVILFLGREFSQKYF